MKLGRISFLLFLLVAVSICSSAYAACGKNGCVVNTKEKCACCPCPWDAKNIKNVAGEIMSLDGQCTMFSGKGCQNCTVAIVKTATGNVAVCLGSKKFLADKSFALKVGDKVAVTGSAVTIGPSKSCKASANKTDLLIAKQISRGKDSLVLRDDKGTPRWSDCICGKDCKCGACICGTDCKCGKNCTCACCSYTNKCTALNKSYGCNYKALSGCCRASVTGACGAN